MDADEHSFFALFAYLGSRTHPRRLIAAYKSKRFPSGSPGMAHRRRSGERDAGHQYIPGPGQSSLRLKLPLRGFDRSRSMRRAYQYTSGNSNGLLKLLRSPASHRAGLDGICLAQIAINGDWKRLPVNLLAVAKLIEFRRHPRHRLASRVEPCARRPPVSLAARPPVTAVTCEGVNLT